MRIKNYSLSVLLALTCLSVSAQDTKIRFFGQPEFSYLSRQTKGAINPLTGGIDDTISRDSRTNFNTGSFVLFVTSQLTERISVLSENSARYNHTNGDFAFNVQRLMFRYNLSDYLSFRAGKMFTPIGYWNNQYNLGLVLQPTISRPLIILPQSEGGVINVADVGVQVEGDNITKARFFYRVMVGNGSGYFGVNEKANNDVSLYYSVGAEPIEGLKILTSGMLNNFKAGGLTVSGLPIPDDGNLWMTNVSLAYMNPEKKLEFIGEFYNQRTNFNNLGVRSSFGVFSYAGFKLGDKVVPYALYNYSVAGKNKVADLYYSPLPVQLHEGSIGIRLKASSNFVTKLEYAFYAEQQLYQAGLVPLLITEDKTISNLRHGPKVQFAFGF